MTTTTLIKKTFHWGGSLTVSEVQSIIIRAGSMSVCRQTWGCLRLNQKATQSGLTHGAWLEHTWDLEACLHNSTFPNKTTTTPTRPHLLLVSLPMRLSWPVTFKLPQWLISNYKWVHTSTYHICLGLGYLTQGNLLQFHPFASKFHLFHKRYSWANSF